MNRQMAALVDLADKLFHLWPHLASERVGANEGRRLPAEWTEWMEVTLPAEPDMQTFKDQWLMSMGTFR